MDNFNMNSVASPAPDFQDGILRSNSEEFSQTVSPPTSYLDSSTVSEAVSEAAPSIYIINEENKWGWITLYVVTIVVAVLGNLLFIIGSLCTRRSRNTGHYLLINLSIRKRLNIILRQNDCKLSR